MTLRDSHCHTKINDTRGDERCVLFHLGFPKTASTWLQRHIFEAETEIFLCPWGPRASRAVDRFVLDSGFSFDPERTRLELLPSILEAQANHKVVVVSEETLIGDICSERYWGPETIRRICKCFPNARILLCIREQRRIIYSAYAEYIHGGGTLPLASFISSDKNREGTGPICRLDALLYHHVIEKLNETFGKESVLVLPSELISSQPSVFITALLQFLGFSNHYIDPSTTRKTVNVSMGAFTQAILRRSNFFRLNGSRNWRFLLRTFNRIAPKYLNDRYEIHQRTLISQAIGHYFDESNRRTSELISIDLGALGYQV